MDKTLGCGAQHIHESEVWGLCQVIQYVWGQYAMCNLGANSAWSPVNKFTNFMIGRNPLVIKRVLPHFVARGLIFLPQNFVQLIYDSTSFCIMRAISNSYSNFNETVIVRHQFLLHCIFNTWYPWSEIATCLGSGMQNRPEVGPFCKIVEFDQSKGIGRLARPRRSRFGYWFGRPNDQRWCNRQ
jgi:hypothetical protein